MKSESTLRAVKIGHTIIWAIFAACIVAIPVFTHAERLNISSVLIAIVLIEVLTIAVNDWHCPLTNVASRYTSNRSENFDIYLPAWLAKYNKAIFGTLFVAGLLYTIIVWVGGHSAA